MKNEQQKHGFIAPVIEPEHWIFGGGNIPDEILQPDGQWGNFLPVDENQDRPGLQTFNCTAYGTLHALSTYMYRKFGVKYNFSERFLGILAGTQPPGNDPHTVCETIRKYGVIPDEMLPFDDSIKTIEQYYDKNAVTQKMLDEGKRWLAENDFRHEWVVSSSVPATPDVLKEVLKRSPLGVGVYAWARQNDLYARLAPDEHWTTEYGFQEAVQPKYWKIFDSSDNSRKNLVWDFGFFYAKQFYVEKKPTPAQIQSLKNQLIGIINQLINYLQSFMKEQTRLEVWANAIKKAEGWVSSPPSKSFRNNNPGNLRYAQQAGSIGKDAENFAVFPSYAVGFQALLHQLDISVKGQSKAYSPEDSLKTFTMKYTDLKEGTNLNMYLNIVCFALGANSDIKIKNIV